MIKPKIIGLGSRAQIGKDYAAEYLQKHYSITRIAFADALKADLAKMLKENNICYKQLETESKTELRPLLVGYGMLMRHIDPDYWINRALNDKQFNTEYVVITDVRFPNERKRIKELGGMYIDITPNPDKPYVNDVEKHYSPQLRETADAVIINNFDNTFIIDLVKTIDAFFKIDN